MAAARYAAAAALLATAVLFCPSAALASRDFTHPVAGVYGRIQLLRSLERQLLANAANSERAVLYLRKRQQARLRIDELMLEARAAAGSAAQRRQLEQLAVFTDLADARFALVLAAVADTRKLVAAGKL